MTDRIERAARAMAPTLWDDFWIDKAVQALGQSIAMASAEAILAAAYPELHGDPPTHWIAPMEFKARVTPASNLPSSTSASWRGLIIDKTVGRRISRSSARCIEDT